MGHAGPRGHTLVEVITVVLILSILACVAVPRLNFGAVTGAKADGVVRRIATDLRRARANAILHAARNPVGCALVMSGSSPYRGYQIVDLRNSGETTNHDIPPDVRCTGGRRFEFGPLGNLKTGSDTQLTVSTDGKTYLLEVVPTTGAVKCTRQGG